jgi:hypothetical protein
MENNYEFDKVCEKIAQIDNRVIIYDRITDLKFMKNNDIYQNIKLVKLHEFKPLVPGTVGKNRLHRYTFRCPSLFYKRGFRNIRCSHQHTIDSIELCLCSHGENDTESEIAKIYNPDGIIFEKLRKIYGIDDPSIIPIITEKFVPYLENCYYTLDIKYNGSEDLDRIDDVQLSYEIVEIDAEDYFTPFQYKINLNKIIDKNEHFKDIQRIIPELEYVTLRTEYTGTECVRNKKSCFQLNFVGQMQKILLYTPKNSVINCGCRIILDENEELQIPTQTCSEGEFVILNFDPEDKNNSSTTNKYSINFGSPSITSIVIDVELKDDPEFDKSDEIEIFGMSNFIYKISNGWFGRLV